ncbi:MAG: DUF447 domain-containing protein [Candidatus Hodarchaeota archaeon]
MRVNYKDLGLNLNYLYEILATTFSVDKSKNEIIPNTACMGVRLINDTTIKITPYPDTKTCKNLKANKYISINFVDDIYLYALAALKKSKHNLIFTEFPSKYYNFYEITKELNLEKILIPFIINAWAVIFCKVIEEQEIIKKNSLGEVKLSEFKLDIIYFNKYKESFTLFNRAENLALEIILLTTRLKVAKEKNNQPLFYKIHEKIDNYIENIERFGKNDRALKAIEFVRRYINTLMD